MGERWQRIELASGGVTGEHFELLDDGRVRCEICPRFCQLKEGQRAFCFVRQARDGEVVLTSYGRSTGFCIDPIEKKPLNHFYPGTAVLSFGTAGCNLGCHFCQNWESSKARSVEQMSERATPEAIALAALENDCRSVAFTYNDPIIFYEYAVDTAQACHERGIQTVAVTAGYITERARAGFFEHLDAANIDLKSFSESFYKRLCAGHLQPVLDTLSYVANETRVWLEITTLLIPGHNDSPEELTSMCDWLVDTVGPDVPLHFSAFHPDFRMTDLPRTPKASLQRARQIARAAGLNYVYTGNLHDPEGQSTRCAQCNHLLIERDWYQLGRWNLSDGTCVSCGAQLPGRFDDRPGAWGAKRRSVGIA